MPRFGRTLAIVVTAAAFASCDESLSDLAGPTPNLEPTFASIQREIFETTDASGRAACVSCHTSAFSAFTGGLSLEHAVAYDQLVNVRSTERPTLLRVAPGNPDASYIVRKVEGAAGIDGRRMPYDGPPYLTDGQILVLRRWIELGAPR